MGYCKEKEIRKNKKKNLLWQLGFLGYPQKVYFGGPSSKPVMDRRFFI